MVANSIVQVFTDVILPVIAVAVVGGIVGRRLQLQLETLQRATFFLFSPALVFTGLATIKLGGGVLGRLALVAVAAFVLNGAIALLWARLRGSDRESAASIAIGSAVPNQGNMGLPLALLAFGPAGLEVATVLFVVGVVLNSTAAVALGQFTLRSGRRRDALLAPLRFPSLYAAVAGIAVNVTNVALPAVISEPATTLSRAAIPVMLLILGMSFQIPIGVNDLADPLFVSINRLLLGPLIAWSCLEAMGVSGTTQHVAIVMAGMPVAVNTTLLARQLNANVSLAVRSVVVSTALSMVTLAVLLSAF